MLALSLINQAKACDLDVPHDLYHDDGVIQKKLNLLGSNPKLWRYTTMSFSLEAVPMTAPAEFDFLETNGSVGTSPAATASVLLHSRTSSTDALNYLRGIMLLQQDGGAPNVAPIDTFEIAWSLNSLRLAGAITADHPQVRRALDFLWQVWQAKNGMCFSSHFSVPDLDCSAVAYKVLRWANYPVTADVFGSFEEDDHFRCYPGEINSSLSAHIRALAALRMVDHHDQLEDWMEKIINVLRNKDLNGYFWFDKWHISPYYLTSVAVTSLQGICDDLVKPRITWITKTQRKDGGWGYYGKSTPEETAYSLQALISWNRYGTPVDETQLHAGAYYLMNHLDDPDYTPLWIGKCLYTPSNVVRSAVMAALYSYMTDGLG